MNTFLFLILIVLVLAAVAYLFKGTNFSNRIRQVGEAVNEGLADPGADGAFAIQDAQTEADSFRSDIAGLITANNGLEKRRVTAQAEVSKFQKLMEAAAAAGNAEDAKEAQALRNKANANVASLTTQINANETLEAKLRDQLADYETQIAEAKDDHARLVVSEKSSQLRKKVAQRAAGVASGKGLGALSKLKERAEQADNEAEAFEELAATSTIGKGNALEAKYGATSAADDEELAKLLAAK